MSRKVLIFTDKPSRVLDLEEIIDYLSGFFNNVIYGGDLVRWFDLTHEELISYKDYLRSIRVTDIKYPLTKPVPELIKRSKEYFGISSDPNKLTGELYDGYWLQRRLFSLIKSKSKNLFRDYTVIIITGKLFGTFEEKRYHARVVLLGSPHIVSTSGVVEAPARPPEYYWIKAGTLQSKKDISEIDKFMSDRYLVYDDPRINKIICSYLLQPLVYDISGRTFCDNTKCCIYNSHWQKEVLDVQYKQKLCDSCSKILSSTNSDYN